MKRKCSMCGVITEDWETIGSLTRCWTCGREARTRLECVHIKGTVIKQNHEYTVTCDKCRAAWIFGAHPAGIQLFDIYGERWY